MNGNAPTPSPWIAPLRVTAALLAALVVGLAIAWSQKEPALPPAPVAAADAGDERPHAGTREQATSAAKAAGAPVGDARPPPTRPPEARRRIRAAPCSTARS